MGMIKGKSGCDTGTVPTTSACVPCTLQLLALHAITLPEADEHLCSALLAEARLSLLRVAGAEEEGLEVRPLPQSSL